MNAFSTASKNRMLDHFAGVYGFASLHSAFPGDTGLNEIAGGSPAYARKAITWNAAASGNLDNNGNPTFDVPAATTVAWLGLWTLATAGEFGGSAPLAGGSPVPFTAETTDIFTAEAHGYSDTNQVFLLDTTGAVIPTGVTEGTIYFVRDSTTNTFKLAATSGGTAIDITAVGAGFIIKLVPETFGSQGTYATTDVDFDLLR